MGKEFECPFCEHVTEFDCDYKDEFPGTYTQNSRYTCLKCGASVTIYEADYEPRWYPPEDWGNKPIPSNIITR